MVDRVIQMWLSLKLTIVLTCQANLTINQEREKEKEGNKALFCIRDNTKAIGPHRLLMMMEILI